MVEKTPEFKANAYHPFSRGGMEGVPGWSRRGTAAFPLFCRAAILPLFRTFPFKSDEPCGRAYFPVKAGFCKGDGLVWDCLFMWVFNNKDASFIMGLTNRGKL